MKKTDIKLAFQILAFASVTFFAGCNIQSDSGKTSSFGQTHQTVTFASLPYDAEVYLDGQFIGTTPCCSLVRRGMLHRLNIYLEGYYEEEMILTPKNTFNEASMFPENIQVRLIPCKLGNPFSKNSRTTPFNFETAGNIPTYNSQQNWSQAKQEAQLVDVAQQQQNIVTPVQPQQAQPAAPVAPVPRSEKDFANLPTPRNYTALRLQEREIDEAFQAGLLTRNERDFYINRLFDTYNAERLMQVKPSSM